MKRKYTFVWNASSGRGNRKIAHKVRIGDKVYLKDIHTEVKYPILSNMRIETVNQYKERMKNIERENKKYQKDNIKRREYLRSLMK